MLDTQRMHAALKDVTRLRNDLLAARSGSDPSHPRYQSLLNLRQYLILRSKDWTELQENLFVLSLSSLGRSFAHVAGSVDTLYDQLASSLGLPQINEAESAAFHHLSIEAAQETIASNSRALFGSDVLQKRSEPETAIMVTLPSAAAEKEGRLIRELADAGVSVFRINTAHDTPETWQAMADIIADLNAGRPEHKRLRIFVDLAGPKIRTGSIRRLKRPVVLGSNKREKPVVILPEPAQTRPEYVDHATLRNMPAEVAIDQELFKTLDAGDILKVTGVNGKHAKIVVTQREGERAVGVINKKIAVDEASVLFNGQCSGHVRNCMEQPDTIRLFQGDRLHITAPQTLGGSAQRSADGTLNAPASIPCTLEGLAGYVQPGERIFIDDGKIGLRVSDVGDNTVVCDVIQAKPGGTLLKEEKGINLPDTVLTIPALTERDRENLLLVRNFADMLGLSFCQTADDVAALQKFLRSHDAASIGIVPKIETREGVMNMPAILEQLLIWERSGVMIARGDLAIEAGFENLAALQESLLDICSAAHIPVIWATQVLENQMKNNLPSRAEITDAAMAGRAECVMLNKGPFAVDTIGALLQILQRMHHSFRKNRQLLRQETLWSGVKAANES